MKVLAEKGIEEQDRNSAKLVQLSRSDIFRILQNDRRRRVLEILRTQGSQSVRSLSEEIARLEPKPKNRKAIS
jgi:predicted transcriptional regulator